MTAPTNPSDSPDFPVVWHKRVRHTLGDPIRYEFPVLKSDGGVVYCYSKSVARRVAESTGGRIIT